MMTVSTTRTLPICARPLVARRSAPRSRFAIRAEQNTEQATEQAAEQATAVAASTGQKIKGFEERVDTAGRAISEATQESSGLTQTATSFEPAQPNTPEKVKEALAFSGPAPERINGRLAMLALVATWGAEVFTGEPLMRQIAKAPLAIGATFLVFIVATLIPIIRGENMDKKSGIFTPRAEFWNGRLAMVAFVLLLMVETFKGGPAFH